VKAASAATALLQDLVRIPSHESEAAVVDLLCRRFREKGIPHETRVVGPRGPGRANFIASWGRGPRSLILNSHMDTVAPGEPGGWTSPPFGAEVRGGLLYGRGSADAKGPLAAMIVAFESIVGSHPDLAGKLILTAVSYEEESGLGTAAEVEAGTRADAAVVGEPTDLRVCTAHKGVLRLRVTARGKAAHASEPWEGANAISRMAPVIAGLDDLASRLGARRDPLLGPATLVVTMIEGGIGRNVVPPSCSLLVDRRLLPGESASQARAEVQAVTEPLGCGVEQFSLAEASSTAPQSPIVERALEARTAVIGEASMAEGFGACCDMWHLANRGAIPTVIFGPGSLSQAHKTDEHVAVADVERAVAVYRRLALDWLAGPGA
jgi:acetylornithine deacetylase/succinyl-diaminopimelate desuccinylase family protein